MRFKFTLELRGVAAAALVAAMAWRCDGLRADGHLLAGASASAGASVCASARRAGTTLPVETAVIRLARVDGSLTAAAAYPSPDAELIVIDAELAHRTPQLLTARHAAGLHLLAKRSSENAFDAWCSGLPKKQRCAGSKAQQTSNNDARILATRRPGAPASAPEQRLGAKPQQDSSDLRRLRRRCINRTPTHKQRRRRVLRRHGPAHESREIEKTQNEAGAPDALRVGWW